MSNGALRVGIDFGTSYCSIACYAGGTLHFAREGREARIPAVVHVAPEGRSLVGCAAAEHLLSSPECTVPSIKRLMGHSYGDRAVRSLDYAVGYEIVPGPAESAVVKIRDERYAPAQLAAEILRYLRDLAEAQFGRTVERAVFSVPVAASEAYQQALRLAAKLAHIDVLQIVSEPVAGILARSLNESPIVSRILVSDFGAGTFDASIVEQDGRRFRAVASDGDDFLGGDDFDVKLADAVSGVLYRSDKVDLHHNAIQWQRLVRASEKTKRALSMVHEAPLHLDQAYTVDQKRHDVHLMIERTWIEPHWRELIERATRVVGALLERQGLLANDIEHVVQIGGTNLVPAVRTAFARLLGREIHVSQQANLAVAGGAAVLASMLP